MPVQKPKKKNTFLRRFKDEGLITDAADIFTLKKEDIQILERFVEKSAENIIEEIKTNHPWLMYKTDIWNYPLDKNIYFQVARNGNDVISSDVINMTKST